MNAVSGTRRAIKELADGTVRVQVDIDPRFRKAFFELFPDIDSPVALAPLVESFEQAAPKTEPDSEPNPEKLKGGELAKLAGRLCNDPAFQQWVFAQSCGPVSGMSPEDSVAKIIRRECGIASRSELDHNKQAATIFHERFRKPWQEANQ